MSIDFKDVYFHIPLQNQSRKYLPFHVQGQTYQFKTLPSTVHTTHGVHSGGQRDQGNGTAKGS